MKNGQIITNQRNVTCVSKAGSFALFFMTFNFFFFQFFNFVFWSLLVAYGNLFPWPGIKPVSVALAAWSLNHGTLKEVLNFIFKVWIVLVYVTVLCENY